MNDIKKLLEATKEVDQTEVEANMDSILNSNANSAANVTVASDADTELEDMPFLSLLSQDLNQYISLEKLNHSYTNVVVIGIGGSCLGAKLLISSFSSFSRSGESAKNFHFIDYIEPSRLEDLANSLDFEQTLFLVQSKSGGTIETATVFAYFLNLLEAKNLKASDHFIFCTEYESPLFFKAQSLESQIFTIPKNIGGRYSILSAMGLVALKLAGASQQDLKSLLYGAKSVLLGGTDKLAYNFTTNNLEQLVLFNYCHDLQELGDWFVQLVSESLGKGSTETVPISGVGPRDQHSLLQMLVDGKQNKLVITIPPFDSNAQNQEQKIPGYAFTFSSLLDAEYEATKTSIAKKQTLYEVNFNNDKPNDELDRNSILYQVGYCIIFFESLVYFIASKKAINPFDQPGVEESKKIAASILL
jgi:glucose-6-phosphate isomerase